MKNKLLHSILFLFFFSVLPLLAQDTLVVNDLLRNAQFEKNDQRAYDQYLSAYSLSRQLNYSKGLRESLVFLSDWERKQGNTAGALRYMLEELDVLSERTDKNRIIQIELETGDIYFSEDLFAESLPFYRKAYELSRNDPSTHQGLILQKLGNTHAEIYQADSAFHYYAQLPAWGKSGNEALIEQLNIMHLMVEAFNKAGDYQKALPFNQRILDRLHTSNAGNESLFVAFNNLGYNYNFLKDYQLAINNFREAIKHCPSNRQEDLASLYSNIGIAYFNLGQFSNAIQSLNEANELHEKSARSTSNQINHLLSNVYLENNDLYNALNYNQSALQNAKENQASELLSDVYYTAAQIHVNLYEYETALDYFQLHLHLSDSLKQLERQRQQELLQDKLTLEKADKEIKMLLFNQEIKDLTIQQLNLEKEKQTLALDKLQLEKDQQQKALALLKQEQAVRDAQIKNQELVANQARQQLQITRQRLKASEQEKALSQAEQTAQMQQLELQSQEARIREDQQKVALLEQENQINRLEITQQENFRQFVYGLGGLGLLILGLILAGLIYSRKANKKLAQKNAAIETQKNEILAERNKSDALLLNILPAFTARELKEKGSATPRKYDNATVLFADFVNFTGISEHMSPEELVEELNLCFKAFDNIVEKYNLEKIKTIGDAYMCVGGLPVPNSTHPQNAARAALDMMNFIQNRFEEKSAAGQAYWQMRIGLHTGPVVAGVVGTSKFAYDIWGNTVNTASRMESNSKAFKINLSGKTYQLLNEHFHCNYRGKIKAKNKGEIDMYFLDHPN